MSHLIIKFLLLLVCQFELIIKAESQCGDWLAFSETKCFKIFESSGLQTYDDAINTCRGNNNESNLVTINSADEQSFLTTFIFTTNQVVDNVWLGAKFIDGQYKSVNGLSLTYTNWAEGYPKNLTDNCVEMHSDADSVGKWFDASCKRKNLVVCQKLPNWSQTHIQEALLSFQETQKSLQETVANLKQNILPLGFIYVQFPNETTPQEMWPWMTWEDITPSYAGMFFRAFGGNSSSFGSTQEGNAPRITLIQSDGSSHSGRGLNIETVVGGWSGWVFSGSNTNINLDTRFYTSGGEVRPINTAILIWKRYA